MIVLALVLMLLATPAWAEWELAVYGGMAFTDKLSFSVPPGVAVNGVKVDTSGEIGGKFGYWFTQLSRDVSVGMGMDVFYFRPNIPAQTLFSSFQGQPVTVKLTEGFNVHTTVIGFDVVKLRVNLAPDAEFPNGRFQPNVSIGPAIFLTSIKTSTVSNDNTTLGFKAAAGAQLLLTDMIGLFGEYRFTHFQTDGTIAGATVSTNVNTHHLVGGLALHF